jgi:6-phosphofructokinase 1
LRGRKEGLRSLNRFGIDGLVVIGGNGTLAGANELSKMGFPVIGVPSTIDNDVFGTDIALGVDTALNTIVDALDKIKDTASSHNRAFLIEVMGRNSGYLALASGIAGGAELVLVPELERSYESIKSSIEDDYVRGKTHSIIMVAEGWKPGTMALAEQLNSEPDSVGFSVRVTKLGHVQRGGSASAFDRILATRLGAAAVREMVAGHSGLVVGWVRSAVTLTPIDEAVSTRKDLDPATIELAGVMAR